MADKVYIFDTTLRDGEQSPGCSMNLEEKLQMARQLDRLNVDILEAGFPIASQGDYDAVKAISAEIRRPIIAALARANKLDIDRAWDALKEAARPRIHTFLATSDIHLQYKLHKTREEILKMISWSVAHAKSYCQDVEFSPEDAGRTDRSYLVECCHAAVEAGATVLNLPDTVGYCLPFEYEKMFADVQARVPGMDKVILSTHTHDDLGLAVANTLGGLRGGARQVECTINGIGERAGNASLEEVVMALHVRRDVLPLYTDIRTEELFASSQLLTRLTGVAVQRNKAIVGRNAFAHEAGIHQDGVLKNAITYEIITPQTVGMPSNQIVLGKHSGRHALVKRFEDLGYKLTKPEVDRAYEIFCQIADRKKNVYDEDLLAIVREGFDHIPDTYSLRVLQSVASTEGRSTATLELEKDGALFHDSATAEGPCDAAFRAVDRITGIPGTILDFSVHTVGAGTDGVAEVTIRARFEGREFTGKSTSHNVVEAATRSYLQAANKAVYEMRRVSEKQAVATASVHENEMVDRFFPGGY
ncbi:MAG TPA: 2-isopropylmalate synthase [Terriglobia bacterium]|jgi:2-isopropylmalate synthase|nr:2-isopropylmalate synthase [Terriglobia bacterium]